MPNPKKPAPKFVVTNPVLKPSGPAVKKAPAPSYARGRATAAGVIAEVNVALKRLEQHSQTLQPKLAQGISEKVAQILPSLGVKNAPPELVATIANNAANLSIGHLSLVQTKDQINHVIADSITQSIHATDEIAQNLRKTPETKTYTKAYESVGDIVAQNAPDLEKAAVLGNIAAISSLPQIGSTVENVVIDQVEQRAEQDAPLSGPVERASVKAEVQKLTNQYVASFKKNLESAIESDQTPTLDRLAEIKNKLYEDTFKTVSPAPQIGKGVSKINAREVGASSATLLGLKPLTAEKATEMGLGTVSQSPLTFAKSGGLIGFPLGLAMATSPRVQQETIKSLIAWNNPKLEGIIQGLSERQKMLERTISELKSKKNTATSADKHRLDSEIFHRRLEFKNNSDRLKFFVDARNFATSKRARFKVLASYMGESKIGMASRMAYGSVTGLIGIPMLPFQIVGGLGSEVRVLSTAFKNFPRSPREFGRQFGSMFTGGIGLDSFKLMVTRPHVFLKNEILMSGKSFGSLALGMTGLKGIFDLKKTLKMAFSPAGLASGMGMSVAGGIMRRIAKATGTLFGGSFLYFLSLGQAALAGFMAGAAVGGLAGMAFGAFWGFQLGLALAPYTLGISIIVFTPLGALAGLFMGGSIGGISGGLIGYGIAAGDTTAISMGVGTAVGGGIGGYAGFLVGNLLAGTIIAICIAVTGGGCLFLVPLYPFIVLGSTLLGAAIGAAIGTLIGYAVGKIIGALGTAMSIGLAVGIPMYFIGGFPLAALTFGTAWLIGGGWKTIAGWFSGAGVGAAGFFSGLASTIAGWVSSAASSLWGTVTGGFGALTNFIGNIASAAIPSSAATALTVGGTIGGLSVGGYIVTAGIIGGGLAAIESELGEITAGDNEFYKITKASDKSHLENPPPDQDLTFTVTLTAKVKLTNIQVTDGMQVIPKDASTFSVTLDKTGAPISPISCPTELEQNATCTETFAVTVNERFRNSIINNTVSVKATPEGQPEKVDSTSIVVTVGNPPTNCFTFVGDWSNSDKILETTAIAELSKSPTYISMVCAAGNVTLNRVDSNSWNSLTCPNTINITNIGLGNQSNTNYVLAHESGHIIQCSGLQVYQEFLNAAPYSREGYLCSYPLDKTFYEDFAETIADYVAWRYRAFDNCGGLIDFPTKYPLHYQFAKEKLFGGSEY